MMTGNAPPLYARQAPYVDQIYFQTLEGDPQDLEDAVFTIAIRDPAGQRPVLSATWEVIAPGTVEFTFASVATLCTKQYELSCDVARDGFMVPIFRLNLPVFSELSS